MLKIFTCCLAIFLSGCGFWAAPPEEEDSSISLADARRTGRGNMLNIRSEEIWQKLRAEHTSQTMQMRLPGQIARLNELDAPASPDSAREILLLAECYFQELTAPDDASAANLRADCAARMLDAEIGILCAKVQYGEERIRAIKELPIPAEKELLDEENTCADSKLELRTLLGIPAGTVFQLKREGAPGFVPPPGEPLLETALLNRPELCGSPVPAEDLAAAVRTYAAGKHYHSAVHRALATALLLFRAPRVLYRRELAERTTPAELNLLIAAIGIGAELELAETELKAAEEQQEKALLLPQKDTRNRIIAAAARERYDIALERLGSVIGEPRKTPAPAPAAPPSGEMLKLLKFLEKYDHE